MRITNHALFAVLAASSSSVLLRPVSGQVLNYQSPASALASVTTGDGNTAVGEEAGASVTSASRSTFVGTSAGRSMTSGLGDNTFVGFDAGAWGVTTETSGVFTPDGSTSNGYYDMTIIGAKAGRHATATDTTIVGAEAGRELTTGVDSTFIGEEARKQVTTGSDNVCVGEDACGTLTTGRYNVAVGNNVFGTTYSTPSATNELTGNSNVGVGDEALYDLAGASGSNTALGAEAGTDIGVAYCNTMIGRGAGVSTEHGSFNTFLGAFAGDDNNHTNRNTQNADANTYVGFGAGRTNREGKYNVIVGGYSDTSNLGSTSLTDADVITSCQASTSLTHLDAGSSGDNTVTQVTALGAQIRIQGNYGVAVGNAVDLRSEGAIAIGASAAITSGKNAIAIGRQATAQVANSIALGAEATVTSQNSIALGPDGTSGTTIMNVGIGTSAPNQYASLDLSDTSKGLLLNRLNRDVLTASLGETEQGLMVFHNDTAEPGIRDCRFVV